MKKLATQLLSKLPKLQNLPIIKNIPESIKQTALIRLFGLREIPLIFFVAPTVKELSDEKCIIQIPLNRRTKNHLGSMYLGTMCIGADLAGGLSAIKLADEAGFKISLAFKELNAQFLKRPEGDTFFTCKDGLKVKALIETLQTSGERHNLPVHITATCPSTSGNTPVAEFTLVLSLKRIS